MSLNDPLSNVMSHILNYEKIGRLECVVKPASKMILSVLKIMNDHRYIGEFKKVDDGKSGFVRINLIAAINKCGVIKPRFSFKKDGLDKYEKRYLPSKDFGIIIVSTPKGIMTHLDAKTKNIGGKLIAYVY